MSWTLRSLVLQLLIVTSSTDMRNGKFLVQHHAFLEYNMLKIALMSFKLQITVINTSDVILLPFDFLSEILRTG